MGYISILRTTGILSEFYFLLKDFRGFYDREKLFWKEIHVSALRLYYARPYVLNFIIQVWEILTIIFVTGHDHLRSLCSPWRGQKSSHASFPTSLQYVQYSVVRRAHSETYLQGQGNQISSNLWTKLISFIEIIIDKYSFHSFFSPLLAAFQLTFLKMSGDVQMRLLGRGINFVYFLAFLKKKKSQS